MNESINLTDNTIALLTVIVVGGAACYRSESESTINGTLGATGAFR